MALREGELTVDLPVSFRSRFWKGFMRMNKALSGNNRQCEELSPIGDSDINQSLKEMETLVEIYQKYNQIEKANDISKVLSRIRARNQAS
jgi:hypothetical protein